MELTDEDITFRPLAASCPRGYFRCGEATIDRWFFKDALKRHDSYSCRVVMAHLDDDPNPIGLYAMGLILEPERYLSGNVSIRNRSQGGYYQAVHIEYLAVQKDYHHRGLGTMMMARALETFRRAVDEIGAPVLTLAPLREDLVSYYADLGFTRYARHVGERRIMLTAEQAVEADRKSHSE